MSLTESDVSQKSVGIVRQYLVCLVLLAGGAVLVEAVFALRAFTVAVNTVNTTVTGMDLMRVVVQAQLAGKRGLIAELTAAARESRKTIDVLQATSLAERRKLAEFSDASIQALNDLDVVARNGAMAVRNLQDAMAGLGGAATALQVDVESAKPTIDGATVLLSTLNRGSDAVLTRSTETIGSLNALVVGATPIEQHLNSVAAHVDEGTKALAETLGFIRDDFRPTTKSFWVRLLDKATSGMFSLMLHWIPQAVHVQ
jgi:hypothetical protein